MKAITNRAELAVIEQPEFTNTWSPWHHGTILEETSRILDSLGLAPISEDIEVSDNGMDMFGSMAIMHSKGVIPSLHSALRLGFRNSMQKRFGLGFVAGEKVMVCSNMQFYGNYRETRVHNAQLTLEALREFIKQAIMSILDEFKAYQAWFEILARLAASEDDIKVLTYDAMQMGILPPSKFGNFLTALDEEKRDQDYGIEQTIAHWHGAVTRTLRGQSTGRLMDRTKGLNEYLQSFIAPPMIDAELVV